MMGVGVRRVVDIEVLATKTPVDALVLENNLIKQYQPRYNIKLKDDKRYPYIKLTTQEPFPALSVTRTVERDGNRYFGPFVRGRATRETLKLLTKVFPVRTCALELAETGNRYKVCLDYHIGRCPGPCADLIPADDYGDIVRNVSLFLGGKTDALLSHLRRKMEDASSRLDFEAAARFRDKMQDVVQATQTQHVDSPTGEDYDAIGCAVRGTLACAQVLMVRDGKLVEREHFFLTDVEGEEPSAILTAFVQQYYTDASFVPATVVLQEPIEMSDAVGAWLESRRGRRVTLHVAQRGLKREMVELAMRNCVVILEKRAAHVVYSAD